MTKQYIAEFTVRADAKIHLVSVFLLEEGTKALSPARSVLHCTYDQSDLFPFSHYPASLKKVTSITEGAEGKNSYGYIQMVDASLPLEQLLACSFGHLWYGRMQEQRGRRYEVDRRKQGSCVIEYF